ncbi:MAG: cytochrome c-type biogenesis protein CcmH [Chloroflexi bacterium]|nr:cytochrome c-type biogenesis protein CcmH [Chloroflexota bacterium]
MKNQKSKVKSQKSRPKILFLFAFFISVALFAFSTSAFAQGPNLDDEVNRISRELYCPVCPNTPLDVCNTQACAQWRALIKDKLSQGESEQQIRDYFVTQYGERVLGAPPAQGFNWLAYILPGLALLGGGMIAWATVLQWRARRAEKIAREDETPLARAYAERIEKDLKET